MALVLTIESSDGPLKHVRSSVRLEANGHLDIGRGASLDWTLPDPTRIISTKHCEIRFRGGRYWLYDVSRNGTFLNREVQRLRAPHPLSHGDRFAMGSYIIAVTLESEVGAESPAGKPPGPKHGIGASPQETAANKTIERHRRSVA